MMFEEFWASRCTLSGCLRSVDRHGALSPDVWRVLGVTVRSPLISEESWASRCVLSTCLRSFGRHGAIPHDV